MTAIKLESDVKMNHFLAQATQALREEDFSLAYDEIQRYLQEETEGRKKGIEMEAVLPIALRILEQGDFQARWDMAKVLLKLGDRVIDSLITVLENEEKISS
jgi:hypothetical protein